MDLCKREELSVTRWRLLSNEAIMRAPVAGQPDSCGTIGHAPVADNARIGQMLESVERLAHTLGPTVVSHFMRNTVAQLRVGFNRNGSLTALQQEQLAMTALVLQQRKTEHLNKFE